MPGAGGHCPPSRKPYTQFQLLPVCGGVDMGPVWLVLLSLEKHAV